jgi:hypothetical protein
MSVWYIGGSDVRVVDSADWDEAGTDDTGSFRWDAINGFSLPDSDFTVDQLAWLDSQIDFWVGAPDGPRSAPTNPPQSYITRAEVEAILRSAELGELTGLSRASVGLDRVDNTSDYEKPLSEAAIAALAEKADYPDAGTDGQVLVKAGTSTAWAPPGGNAGSVGVAAVTGDSYWPDGSLFNITGTGVAQAPDDDFWAPGTLYTVN